jgi:hypothetical protein
VTELFKDPELRADIPAAVRERCVSFALDAPTERTLRAAGADAAMLQVFRTACFTGTEIVVDSWPAGADISIDGQRIGSAPWTGRFNSTGSSIRITAQANGKAQTLTAALQPATRQRVWFSIASDTTELPLVPTRAAVIRQLDIASRWRAPEAPPIQPVKIGRFESSLMWTTFIVGGGVGTAYYCGQSTHQCGVPTNDPGTGKATKGNAHLVGWLGGALAGAIVANTIDNKINGSRRAKNERNQLAYQSAQASWERRMTAARDNWIQNHPDVTATIRRAEAERAAAAARNRDTRAENQARQSSRVTSEPISTGR